jgi:AraC-like DNA-binding protein
MRKSAEVAMQSAASAISLSRFFEDIRLAVPAAGRALSVELLPDGRTRLVFRVLEEGRRGDLCVAGVRTRAIFKTAPGVVQAIVFPFRPGWSAPLLGVAANALTDQIVPLEEIWRGAGGDLCRDLLAASSPQGVLERVVCALAARARQTLETSSARLARQAVRLLEADEDRVESVAKRLGVTARHLHRAFTENVGIGPKEFARTVRLQRAVRTAATSKDWARIAADAGYYDQAHLIGDFREFVGLTPGAFARESRDGGVRFISKECAGATGQH